MIHGPLERSKALNSTPTVSRHSQNSTEASFRSASETIHLQIMPKSAASQPEFPHLTSSVKEGQPFRKAGDNTQLTAPPAGVMSTSESVNAPTAGICNHFGSKHFADLPPLTQNPPTPRNTRNRPHKARNGPSKRSTKSSHAVVEPVDSITKSETAVSRKKPDLEQSDHLKIRRNVVAETLVAPQASKEIPKSQSDAGGIIPVKSAMLFTLPTVPASAQPQATLRCRSSPPTQREISLTALPPPPLPYSGSDAPDDLKDAAEMSIARQVSISYRQRELLVPSVPKVARQPMLIDVSDGSHVARKSQYLVLEDV